MYLFGASGHAKVIIDILKANNIDIKGLFDDNITLNNLAEYPVIGKFDPTQYNKIKVIVSIGSNQIRKKIAEMLSKNVEFITVSHPSSIISANAIIGSGSVIMQNSVIQSSVRIGNHCIINTSSSVDHDCTIEDFVHISPNSCLCGGVYVGEGTQIGAGSVVIPGIKIGKWSMIAAGSVVYKDVPDNVLVLGNPARVIKKLE